MNLTFDGLTKRYGDHTVIDRITATLDFPHVLALLGPSGGGKSTLAAQQVNSTTYSTLESYLPLALGYLAMPLPVSLVARRLEQKFRYET